jgi:hypothetical protein
MAEVHSATTGRQHTTRSELSTCPPAPKSGATREGELPGFVVAHDISEPGIHCGQITGPAGHPGEVFTGQAWSTGDQARHRLRLS